MSVCLSVSVFDLRRVKWSEVKNIQLFFWYIFVVAFIGNLLFPRYSNGLNVSLVKYIYYLGLFINMQFPLHHLFKSGGKHIEDCSVKGNCQCREPKQGKAQNIIKNSEIIWTRQLFFFFFFQLRDFMPIVDSFPCAKIYSSGIIIADFVGIIKLPD